MRVAERGNVLSTVAGRVFGIGSFALSTILIGVTLDLRASGTVLYIQAISATLAVVTSFGEERYATLLFARSTSNTWRATCRYWTRTSVWRRVGKGIAVALAVAALCSWFCTPVSTLPRGLAFASVGMLSAALGIQRILAEALRAGGHVVHANLGTGRAGGVVTQSVFALLLLRDFLVDGRGALSLETALIFLLAASFIGIVHVAFVFWRLGAKNQAPVDEAELRAIQHSPIETLLASGSGALFSQSDMLLAGLVLGPVPLGVYGLARRIGVLVNTPGYVANLVVVRRIATLAGTNSSKELSHVLPQVSAAATIVSLLSSLPLVLAPSWLYEFLVPADQVQSARYVLASLALGQVLNVASGSCGTVLLLTGRQRPMIRAALIGMAGISLVAVLSSITGSLVMFALGATAATALYFGSLAYSARVSAGVTTDILGVRRKPFVASEALA